ncbi:hypothetical protein CPB85DRAFT_245774 [Mucidula mucida]|nr:hypothetical protein CPB85DRAFT_245774 [Mucidula mucida]
MIRLRTSTKTASRDCSAMLAAEDSSLARACSLLHLKRPRLNPPRSPFFPHSRWTVNKRHSHYTDPAQVLRTEVLVVIRAPTYHINAKNTRYGLYETRTTSVPDAIYCPFTRPACPCLSAPSHRHGPLPSPNPSGIGSTPDARGLASIPSLQKSTTCLVLWTSTESRSTDAIDLVLGNALSSLCLSV